MTAMRAKMVLYSVTPGGWTDNPVEILRFGAVCGSFDENGLSEDNTFAKYSPSATVDITIANPALIGKFKPGEKYYIDFTLAEAAPAS
jgi:hypothetical protein